ncbi:MAG: hypothetical protein H6977_01675 [Gammaproteobacteria bacterium]|nr:hypothetical protein [Gammaproteobacteria bacterium]MCP5198691.1 hypothetical protein [Gammaproteobacteria bacterium]
MRLRQLALVLITTSATTVVSADDVLGAPNDAAAIAQTCPRTLAEEPLATEYGSAGIMKNLAETDDSLKAIASRLLAEALTVENKKPAPGCTPDCPDDGVAEVIYRVAPMSFLPRGEQNALCLQLEDETAAAPLSFTPPTFGGVEALNRWISELSQGRGDDGKALYERCASNCSPRYTFFIASEEAGYSVRAEVLCGLARDKSNDQYLISTALRRSCAVD